MAMTDSDRDRKSSRVLYELMFEDMSPSKFLKAAKKAVTKAKQDIGQCRILLMALLNWVDDNPIRFGTETAMGKLTEMILRVEDDDELENDDVLAFIGVIREFLKTVTVKDIMSAEKWEGTANMSPNLLALFGKPTTPHATPKAAAALNARYMSWKPPSKAGLDNSEPIFVSAKSASQYTHDKHVEESPVTSTETTPPPMAEPKDSPKMSRQNSAGSSKRNSEKGGDDDEDEDDDDDDYYYDEDEEGEEEEYTPPANMSLNLMRALGMDTTGMECETDWKPPDKVGIEANPDSLKVAR